MVDGGLLWQGLASALREVRGGWIRLIRYACLVGRCAMHCNAHCEVHPQLGFAFDGQINDMPHVLCTGLPLISWLRTCGVNGADALVVGTRSPKHLRSCLSGMV